MIYSLAVLVLQLFQTDASYWSNCLAHRFSL